MKGQQKKRGNYFSFLMEMLMKCGRGVSRVGGCRGHNRGRGQVERHRVNGFLSEEAV